MWESRAFCESVKVASKREAITVIGADQHGLVVEEGKTEAIRVGDAKTPIVNK